MTGPIKLVPKPTPAEEVKSGVIEVLENALRDAKEGLIGAILIVERDMESTWAIRCSQTFSVLEEIGALQSLMWERLKQVDTSDDDC